MSTQKLNVLVIDRQIFIRAGIRRTLKELGVDSGEADTAEHTLLFLASGEYNVAIIGDLPGADAQTELTQAIRRQEAATGQKRTTIVALANNIDDTGLMSAVCAGASTHLLRPVTKDALQETLGVVRGLLYKTAHA